MFMNGTCCVLFVNENKCLVIGNRAYFIESIMKFKLGFFVLFGVRQESGFVFDSVCVIVDIGEN